MAAEPEISEFTRELRLGMPQTKAENVNGGLLIPGVRLLATGAWTDSLQKREMYYSPAVLKKEAGNWHDTTIWSKHTGGVPWSRSIVNNVGEIQNIRYENEAVTGDLFFHMRTQESKDTVALIQYKNDTQKPIFVSVEHGGQATWNTEQSRYEATKLEFSGMAVVHRGACATCTIPGDRAVANSAPDDEEIFVEAEQTPEGETMTDEEKHEEETVSELESVTSELKALQARVEALTEKLETDEAKSKELGEALLAINERVKKVEAVPVVPKTKAVEIENELQVPDFVPKINRSLGEIHM